MRLRSPSSPLLLSVAAAVAVAACGGNEPAAKAPASQSGNGSAQQASDPASGRALPPFSSLRGPEKAAHMKNEVVPRVKDVFAAHDPDRAQSFGCETCHGPTFADPHTVLPKLKLSEGGFDKLVAEKPELVKLMVEVETAMAAAMGEPPYDPKTHEGFGCGGCHAVD